MPPESVGKQEWPRHAGVALPMRAYGGLVFDGIKEFSCSGSVPFKEVTRGAEDLTDDCMSNLAGTSSNDKARRCNAQRQRFVNLSLLFLPRVPYPSPKSPLRHRFIRPEWVWPRCHVRSRDTSSSS